jgi:hypothetical protein
MGNNRLGATFAKMAETIVARRREGETALEILDAAAEAADIRGMDMDFDGQDSTSEPLGRLLFEAFSPNGVADIERYDEVSESIDDGEFEYGSEEHDAARTEFDAIYEAVYGEFRKRYELC